MRADTFLRWLEQTLLTAGLTMGVWCGTILLEAHFVATMPVPNPPRAGVVEVPAVGGSTSVPAPVPGSWFARLDAPSVRLSATVLEGSDDATLARGAGHIEDTAFPGQPGNIGIAGHRDTTFRAVRDLHTGDPLQLTTSDRVYRYQITKSFIVDPEDVYVLDPGDRPMLTLITCFPFTYIGHAPHRYVIQAVLVDQKARGIPDEPKQVEPPRGLESRDNKAPRGILILTSNERIGRSSPKPSRHPRSRPRYVARERTAVRHAR